MEALLVAVDVDGTLLNTEFDNSLRRREVEALEAVRRAGHEVALCTGRNLRSLEDLLERSRWYPEDLPLVLLNGALVWGGRPRRCLACHLLTADQIRRLVLLFRQYDTVPLVYGSDDDGGQLHHEARPVNDILAHYLSMRRQTVGAITVSDDLLSDALPRAMEVGTIDEEEKIRALSRAILTELSGQVHVINTRSLLGEGRYYWAEVYNQACNKGSGLRTLAATCGISHERIVAIGDNFNDLDMFGLAGYAVAMANSPDEVKAEADAITASVDDCGAAQVLEQIAAGTSPACSKERP